jgi:hypothetical protein
MILIIVIIMMTIIVLGVNIVLPGEYPMTSPALRFSGSQAERKLGTRPILFGTRVCRDNLDESEGQIVFLGFFHFLLAPVDSGDIYEQAVVKTVAGFFRGNSTHLFGITRFGAPGISIRAGSSRHNEKIKGAGFGYSH